MKLYQNINWSLLLKIIGAIIIISLYVYINSFYPLLCDSPVPYIQDANGSWSIPNTPRQCHFRGNWAFQNNYEALDRFYSHKVLDGNMLKLKSLNEYYLYNWYPKYCDILTTSNRLRYVYDQEHLDHIKRTRDLINLAKTFTEKI